MDKDTILFLIAIVGCAVGVAGFFRGMTTGAKQTGELLAQIKFCVSGIEKIERDIAQIKTTNTSILTETATQGNRIATLEREMRDIKKGEK